MLHLALTPRLTARAIRALDNPGRAVDGLVVPRRAMHVGEVDHADDRATRRFLERGGMPGAGEDPIAHAHGWRTVRIRIWSERSI